MSANTTIRRVLGATEPARVFHRCGERMLHLSTYLAATEDCPWVSDWWCNRCLVRETVGGDEDYPVPLAVDA